MSRETQEWRVNNLLVGYEDMFGPSWWHRGALRADGTPNHFPGAIPLAEVKKLLDISFSPRRCYYESSDGGLIEATDRRAWARDDTDDLIEIHSDGYVGHAYWNTLVRHIELVLGQNAGSGANEIGIGGAGLLSKGAVAYVQFRMKEALQVRDVYFYPWLMSTTSFDGSLATTFKRGQTKVVCDNTRDMALMEPGGSYRIKHTRNSQLRVSEARQALSILNEQADLFAKEVETLLSVEVSDQQWRQFLEVYAPVKEGATQRSVTMAENKRGELAKLWNHDTRVQPWAGSAYGVVQAVNTFVHHVGIVRNAGRAERNMMRAAQGSTLDRDTLALLNTVLQVPELAVAGR